MLLPLNQVQGREGGPVKDLRSEKGSTGENGPQIHESLSYPNSGFREQLKVAFDAAYKRGIKKRMPYFFTTLENSLELSAEELAYIRSDEPLYADGDISDFVARLRRQYEKSGSALDYDKWIWQTWLIAGPAQRM